MTLERGAEFTQRFLSGVNVVPYWDYGAMGGVWSFASPERILWAGRSRKDLRHGVVRLVRFE